LPHRIVCSCYPVVARLRVSSCVARTYVAGFTHFPIARSLRLLIAALLPFTVTHYVHVAHATPPTFRFPHVVPSRRRSACLLRSLLILRVAVPFVPFWVPRSRCSAYRYADLPFCLPLPFVYHLYVAVHVSFYVVQLRFVLRMMVTVADTLICCVALLHILFALRFYRYHARCPYARYVAVHALLLRFYRIVPFEFVRLQTFCCIPHPVYHCRVPTVGQRFTLILFLVHARSFALVRCVVLPLPAVRYAVCRCVAALRSAHAHSRTVRCRCRCR